MVSLGSNQRSPGGGYFFNPDTNQLFDETDEASLVSSVLVSDEEPNFRTIPLTGVIVFEIVSTIALLVSSFLVPLYNEVDACFILSCAHAGYWCFLFITSGYRNYHHNHIQRCGYLEFFRNTQLLQKVPLLIPSLGNALLVVTLAVFQRYCPNYENCPPDGDFKCHNYLQIFFGSEVFMLLIFLTKYLVLVVKFNRSKAIPDVHQDELLVNYVQSYAPLNEVGFRDEDYLEEVLEKQADMIRYLKQHSNNLSRKIMKLGSQLESIQNNVQKF
ncbi:transmembrane protein 192-like [Uloborus diversus]|uniref:transmembrane protein 192-like n=1 Tax=Uloborus diversus TaxID=327109 RepID=UPI002409F0EB|nr:transmembrane protein 192-like [Uloborus diversus]